MSQLLGRIAKLSSSSSQRLCSSELRRFHTAAKPYLFCKETNFRKPRTPCGGMVFDMNFYDPMKEERVKISDQTLSKELDLSARISSSRGWVALKHMDDFTVRLTNMFNPCASVSSHKVITLPPLDDSKARIASISLSASPNQQDFVVAAKSTNRFMSLCRPGDSDWTQLEIPFSASTLTYSVRDEKFYLYCRQNEEYEGPTDLINPSSSFPQVSLYQSFPNSDIPKSRQDDDRSPLKTQYLVESPSGDSFIVYWCTELLKGGYESIAGKIPPQKMTSWKPRGFLVFRQDTEQRIGSYTEDIGDLCIFLGKNEAFCVSATEYPGLRPNSIYYACWYAGFGCYDLSSNTHHDLVDEEASLSKSYMWLAPLSSES